MFIVLITLLMALFVLMTFSHYCDSLSNKLHEVLSGASAYDAIIFHVYRLNNNGAMPLRGRLVAQDVSVFAVLHNCPVCITVGEASEQDEPDSVVNARYLTKDGRRDMNIVFGQDMSVRTTHEEVREAMRLAKANQWNKVLVVGALPHLPRIVRYWKQAQSGLNIHYWGASVPWYYYFYDLFMILAEFLLPVGTKRRNWCLKLAHRGPKQK